MSDRGVFGLDRDVLNHEVFPDIPYSEKEAWIWLIAEAAWKKRLRRIGKFTADLERGQLLVSVRFLAEKWQWSKGRVECFLNKLKSKTMIRTVAGTGITIITICNYAKYQKVGLPDRTDDEEEKGQLQDSFRTASGQLQDNTEEIKHLNIKTLEGVPAKKEFRKKARRSLPDIFPMADAHRKYAEERGYKHTIFGRFGASNQPGPAQEMFEAFKNHHIAAGSLMADWDAAWRTWVNNRVRWDTEKGTGPFIRRGRL